MLAAKRSLPVGWVLIMLLGLWGADVRAGRYFLQNATEQTVTQVLHPWTQASACPCCVCWETAIVTVLSYWDDFQFRGQGPWERILMGADRWDPTSFEQLTDRIWQSSGIQCGAGGWSFFVFDEVITATQTVVNDLLGYDFEFDYDEWVWFGQDIEDEIRDHKPVYYAFSDDHSSQPEGWQETDGHAITIVGVDTGSEVLYVYGNWDEVVSLKGFDDADDHAVIDITPGGRDCDPGSHQPQPTSCGVGACASTGWIQCPAGFYSDTCTPGHPAPGDPTCNGIDDDCDGAFDENFVSRASNCGVGVCATTGTITCSSGSEQDNCTPLTPPSSTDTTCDGLDDDCNGTADEDYPSSQTTCGVGACAANGTLSCIDGAQIDNCTPSNPAPDDASCNGRDDDCDSMTDEDYRSRQITCAPGTCKSNGVTSCVNGQEVDDCGATSAASNDLTCDGIDDDCDGQTDEDCQNLQAASGCTCSSQGRVVGPWFWLLSAFLALLSSRLRRPG